MNELHSLAYAKINLTLGVTGRREDGYHTVDTVMQSVSLADEVTVKKKTDISVGCVGADVNEQDNTAYKAARLFFDKTGISGGAEINIVKRIPASSGLGGGSADAAAVLLSLNKLYGTELDTRQLCDIAVGIGADVPFFTEGGTRRAKGIGEILSACDPLPDCAILIIKYGEKPSTADMYRRLDACSDLIVPDNDGLETVIKEGNLRKICRFFANSFEPLWNNADLKKLLDSTCPMCVSLSGSGPSVFAIYGDKISAAEAKSVLDGKGYECYLTKPVNCGVKFE